MFSSYCRRATAGLGTLCLACSAPESSAQVTLPPTIAPAAVSDFEYFFDTDPGIGNGIAIAATPGTDITATPSIPLTGLQAGIHRLYFRAKGANGAWGISTLRLLYVEPRMAIGAVPASPVSAIEYFFDTDPGTGRATPMVLTAGADIASSASISATSLSAGVHYLGIRAANASGHWSLTNRKAVYVVPSISLPAQAAPAHIVRAEYFVDTDPGSGLATPIPLSTGTDVSIPGFIASLGAAAAGVHHIAVRFQDAGGTWSLTDRNKFSVIVANVSIPPATSARTFTTLEYFFDTDPGPGNGIPLNVPATTDLNGFSFAADVSTLSSGAHVLYARTVGNWSITSSQAFSLASPLPVGLVHFNAQRLGTTVHLSWETAKQHQLERFVVERSSDAVLFDSIGMVEAGNGQGSRYSFQDEKPFAGTSYYRLRETAKDGSVTLSRTIPLRFENGASQPFSFNNPVGTQLRIFWTITPPEHASFRILNQQGQVVTTLTGSGGYIEKFDVAQLPAGSYLLQHQDGNAQHTLRFQKR